MGNEIANSRVCGVSMQLVVSDTLTNLASAKVPRPPQRARLVAQSYSDRSIARAQYSDVNL